MRTWARTLIIATLSLLACVAGAADRDPGRRPVLLTPDKVWTGDGAPHAGWSVLVAQGRIQGAGPLATLPVPADVDRIALPGKTLLACEFVTKEDRAALEAYEKSKSQ